MSEKRTQRVFLHDIINEVDRINRILTPLGYDDFFDDEISVYAIMKCYEIIGEAARNLAPELKSQMPRIPWQDVITMRNKITHEYWGADVKVMWDTAKFDLPILRDEVQKCLESLPEEFE